MQTDDFLADLEAQLRDARPRRRPSAVLLVIPAIAIAFLVGALAGGGDATESEVVATPPADAVEVLVRNGSSQPGTEAPAAAELRDAGYRVTTTDGLDPGDRSQVDFSGDHLDEAQAIADRFDIKRVIHAYGVGLPDVVVTLGDDYLDTLGFGGTVLVLNASGDPQAADRAGGLLAQAGLRVVASDTVDLELDSRIEVFARNVDPGTAVAGVLGLEDAPKSLDRNADAVAQVAVTLGQDFAQP